MTDGKKRKIDTGVSKHSDPGSPSQSFVDSTTVGVIEDSDVVEKTDLIEDSDVIELSDEEAVVSLDRTHGETRADVFATEKKRSVDDGQPLDNTDEIDTRNVVEDSDLEEYSDGSSHPKHEDTEIIDLSSASPLPEGDPKLEVDVEKEPVEKNVKPKDRFIRLVVNSILPGKPKSQELNWKNTTTFYVLEDTYGREATISYKDKIVPHFKSPAMLADDSDSIELLISTARQFKEILLRKEEERSGNNVPEETVLLTEQATEDLHEFPITLQGKLGRLQVRVSTKSKVEDIVNHYLKKQNINCRQAYAKFDGDKVEQHKTIGDLELEEDDNLDIYIEQ